MRMAGKSRLANIDAVDLPRFDNPHADGHRQTLNQRVEDLSAFSGKLLAVFRRGSLQAPGRMTAAATTGPANGPQPASSTPAMQP